MDLWTGLVSVLAAGSLLLSGTLEEAAPQHDADGLLFLVNRQYMVSDAFEPADLVEAQVPGQVREMRAEAAAALEEMYAACLEETGAQLISVSGYRSYTKQSKLYKAKLQRVNNKVELAQEYVAPPGASEHHLGLAMDIGQQSKPTLNEKFAETEGGLYRRIVLPTGGGDQKHDHQHEDRQEQHRRPRQKAGATLFLLLFHIPFGHRLQQSLQQIQE